MIHNDVDDLVTVRELLAELGAFRAWVAALSPEVRQLFLRQAGSSARALAPDEDPYRRCIAARRQYERERNEKLYALLQLHQLPTATLENWRAIHAQASIPHCTATARALRRSDEKYRRTLPMADRPAA